MLHIVPTHLFSLGGVTVFKKGQTDYISNGAFGKHNVVNISNH